MILKDLQNICTKAKLQAKGSFNEAQITINRLEEEMQRDRGSKGGVIVNYVSSHLVCLYDRFPEVVMIDGTCNVNASRMPLYSFMIEDGNDHGRTIFMQPLLIKAHNIWQPSFKHLNNAIHLIQTPRFS